MKFPPCEIDLTGGGRVVLREADVGDAPAFLAYLRDEVALCPYVLTVPEEAAARTLEDQRSIITKRRDDPCSLILLALVGEELAGVSSLLRAERIKSRHNADFGTTVAAAWRGRGIGRAMLRTMIEWARANPGILRLTLDVMAPNEHAHRMYHEAGFRDVGVARRAVRQPDGTLADSINMDLWVG